MKKTTKPKTRIEEIDNEKVKGIDTSIKSNNSGEFDLEIKYEDKIGLGYDGCGTHTHK
jgi:ribosomal protein S13